ncbi:uncharacterized protein PgNI_09078 [Pyricularia grisea]|uniref:Uncharacterized protein n=1 Tax=Pyricularia grisea TaxID=148305 RepID=A0A6P8ARL1_PYRGI|nr:uncharacterized protein PgNI_09078 [Pyricularia grisea]TLD04769.1 hypothetical protein PgNI_09078 [Pyricularia grisea]
MTIWTPAPCASTNPDRDDAMGRDISLGARPAAYPASVSQVAFMLANLNETSSTKSSEPPIMHTFAF